MITDLMPLDAFSMLRDIDRILDRPSAPSRWLPRIDIFDRDTNLVIRIEVAGEKENERHDRRMATLKQNLRR